MNAGGRIADHRAAPERRERSSEELAVLRWSARPLSTPPSTPFCNSYPTRPSPALTGDRPAHATTCTGALDERMGPINRGLHVPESVATFGEFADRETLDAAGAARGPRPDRPSGRSTRTVNRSCSCACCNWPPNGRDSDG
jgi:hypothetical protein